jgi:competence protein ComEA
MHWKDIVKDYLTFTRKERIGIFVLIALILIIWFLPAMIGSDISAGTAKTDTSWMTAVKQLEIKDSSSDTENNYRTYDDGDGNSYAFDRKIYKNSNNYSKGEPFYFDPNSLSAAGWKKLGLREKTIGIIQNYLSKGGHFYKPGDLQKIYGLFPDEFERIAPYIKIQNANQAESFAYKESNKSFPANNSYAAPKPERYKNIDINNADTSSLIALPGIGSKLAARIVAFRDKLGGFYSVEQIKETYGLPDSSFQKVKQYLSISNTSLKKININTATKDEMKMHPYIKWNLANAIVEYRNQHGEYKTVDDIKKIMAVTDDVFAKASPYLSVQ